MKTKHLILPASFIAGALLLSSCKKHNDVNPSVTYHFEVDFNTNTMDISQVDSATISVKVNDQTIVKRLQKGANSYSIDSLSLSSTPTSVSVSVYAPKDPTGQGADPSLGRIFVYDISGSDTFKLLGPSDVKKDNWKPRAIVKNVAYGVQLTFGENPDDPYFSIKVDNPTIWTDIQVVRDASNNSTEVGGKSIDIPPFANGSNIITNTTGFASYATSMHNQPWTFGAILVNMGYGGNSYVVQLYYQYDSRN